MIDLGLVAERLRNARINQDLTQEEAAEKLGVSTRTIRNWETDGIKDLISLDEVCHAYEAVLTDIIGGQNDLAYLEAAIRRLGPNSCGVICGICKSLGWR